MEARARTLRSQGLLCLSSGALMWPAYLSSFRVGTLGDLLWITITRN